jgi:predicted MFS family arabinose efflux permease
MIVNAVNAGALLVIGPLVADDTFGRTGWGLTLAVRTAGSLLGGIVAARWQPRRMLLIGVALVMVNALPILALGETPYLLPLLLAMFLAGVAIEQFAVAWDVSLQENIPPAKLARVYSYDMLGSFVAMPLGQIAAGPLAEHAGRSATLVGGAALVVGATAIVLLNPRVRGLVRHAPVSPGAPG